MSTKLQVHLGVVIVAATTALVAGLLMWESTDAAFLLSYALVTLLAFRPGVPLPGTSDTLASRLILVLIGIAGLGLLETAVIDCVGALIQRNEKPRRGAVDAIFPMANTATAIGLSYGIYHVLTAGRSGAAAAVAMLSVAGVFYAAESVSEAAWRAFRTGNPFWRTWKKDYFPSFPSCWLAGAVAGLLSVLAHQAGWALTLLLLPLIHFVHRSVRLYPTRLEAEQKHVSEMAELHLRIIEALALAIEAKDNATHAHLRRVKVYALEIGEELGLDETALQALRAAALLHDIGKLAIPEHIISKPGRLTPDEFDKVKTHPLVGAEILERVRFPYPAAPIVRSHHEKWNGSGYPDGLSREEIPVGARILAAVDCLDALASDRPCRRALPLEEAIETIVEESGKSYDPKVVEVLKRRYLELEKIAQSEPDDCRFPTELRIRRGDSPAAGFEGTQVERGAESNGMELDFLASIARAGEEVQMLFDLSRDLGTSLSLDETLSVLTVQLNRLVPYDSVVLYTCHNETLVPTYVNGENSRLFSKMQVALGDGLSGWVAANGRPIMNGNPTVEPGSVDDPAQFGGLRSAMAIPLEGLYGFVGVLMLCRREKNAFTREHLRILSAVSHKVALSIENALKYRQAESNATTDYLTSLPNARSLFMHLDSELSRCKRAASPLAVLLCDLDEFKKVNDQYGHLEGNEVLRSVAHALRDACREYDYVARMGGDEFVMVLPGLDPTKVDEKVEQLRLRVSKIRNEPFLTLSVGQAFYPQDGDNVERLLAAADVKMYKDKQARQDSQTA